MADAPVKAMSPVVASDVRPTPVGAPGDSEAETCIVRMLGVRKAYGKRPVLVNLDLDVRRGEHVALIGPSGSGKTTVLRVLCGLERPDHGSVTIDGSSLWNVGHDGPSRRAEERHLREVRTKVGMVFQHFNLFPHLTALQNVTLAPRVVGKLSSEQAEETGKSLLARVGLSEHVHHRPGQLSGGQQQRVAIARALALRPKVMLFDEVTSALDPELVNEVLHIIRALAEETDMTMMVVTHEMSFAADVADRVLMFDGGRIIEEGPPQKVFENPDQARTRSFLKAIIDRRGA